MLITTFTIEHYFSYWAKMNIQEGFSLTYRFFLRNIDILT